MHQRRKDSIACSNVTSESRKPFCAEEREKKKIERIPLCVRKSKCSLTLSIQYWRRKKNFPRINLWWHDENYAAGAFKFKITRMLLLCVSSVLMCAAGARILFLNRQPRVEGKNNVGRTAGLQRCLLISLVNSLLSLNIYCIYYERAFIRSYQLFVDNATTLCNQPSLY